MKKILLIAFLLFSIHSFAQHVRGGEVTYRCTGGMTYEFTITIWGDSITPNDSLEFYFGDNSNVVLTNSAVTSFTNAGATLPAPYTSVNEIVWMCTHTYPWAASYTTYASYLKRTAGILTIPNSIHTTFELFTPVLIHMMIGCNSTPVFAAHPFMYFASQSQSNTYSVSSTDADGDSIAYAFAPCSVPGSSLPDAVGGGTLTMNAVTGQFSWNNPTQAGTYSVLIRTEHWRHMPNNVMWVAGYIEQEIQFIVGPPNGIGTAGNANAQVSVYPNPGSGTLIFQMQNMQGNKTIVVCDQLGKETWRKETANEKEAFATENFAAGLYFYTIRQENNICATGKIVIQ